ncbi:MAG TPA: thioredoxin [Saprospiraceae bacterium]
MQHTKNQKSFNDIIRSEPLVLVDFYTEWCGPCKMMKPILEQVHASLGNQVKILKVDVDKNPSAGQAFQIRGVPTLVLFKRGEIVWRQSGVVPAASLQQLIKSHQSN